MNICLVVLFFTRDNNLLGGFEHLLLFFIVITCWSRPVGQQFIAPHNSFHLLLKLVHNRRTA